MLEEAGKMNPGPWALHSQVTAEAARAIAERCPDMDGDTAYVMGLLHDIGRREGFKYLQHTLDGYRFLTDMGYVDAAVICLTHSLPNKGYFNVCRRK